ncbi:zinc ribbon domain-containing protein [Anabaena cylindrica FACHB-243]|uniref:Uncharacterized protein n=1 Tax=Anabaena cylindrica (strain ATCC 27899 / PCC 7122) TaxID=272123 RepID=K9ZE96_ANACC|nr:MULTISPECIES: zinc ribbon domain-containing protein [Anabaena]AFZ56680.1 hypothetical protein Anacy_1115 [Anabaena cylindrica PCC 7122]MBD2419441.1 zinc ribbon domain-containing protein [Anabaena cylindrica FACHB-243]MBY5283876.1 hypothetical protein [Anabaena sp. CCAP 1446/1C]MBY5308786.1 hypothetical protein [Anabaena sp. CCAP 1446/1C]MCM2408936.1 zinc ribbon domain-containing protein [Anabaena sp. CCAP 1446/1C]
MSTVSCSRCHQTIDSQAISCPYCRITLKAYGHPGVPLHQANGDYYLCESCVYHQDDSCNFIQRPYAKSCTLYQNLEESKLELLLQQSKNSGIVVVKNWLQRHQALLLLIFIFLVCLLIALSAS